MAKEVGFAVFGIPYDNLYLFDGGRVRRVFELMHTRPSLVCEGHPVAEDAYAGAEDDGPLRLGEHGCADAGKHSEAHVRMQVQNVMIGADRVCLQCRGLYVHQSCGVAQVEDSQLAQ